MTAWLVHCKVGFATFLLGLVAGSVAIREPCKECSKTTFQTDTRSAKPAFEQFSRGTAGRLHTMNGLTKGAGGSDGVRIG